MIPASTPEERRLQAATRQLQAFASLHNDRKAEAVFQVLEAAASRLGRFDLAGFQEISGSDPIANVGQLMDVARGVVAAIEASGIHPALALSALAREELDGSRRRGSGAYHTDFRLAQHLAESVRERLKPGVRVADPACGAGMLLTAVSLTACGPDRVLAADWLAQSVHACDLSEGALRGTLIALASLTDSLAALRQMRARWRAQDSLLASGVEWQGADPCFDVVVANPPWEKVKLSRHEFIKGRGGERHYGADYDDAKLVGYDSERGRALAYADQLAARYPTLREGEADLYVAFAELLLRMTKPGGAGALLVPGGLIRSKNTAALRRLLMGRSSRLDITVLENRARFFAIDTRFKFLLVRFEATKGRQPAKAALRLRHGTGTAEGVSVTPPVAIGRSLLREVRPDLTVPEIRSTAEWRLFVRMQRKGLDPSDETCAWHPQFCREVDMTHARRQFEDTPAKGRLPLVEGRMIQPHRFGAKAYTGGRGRAARWELVPAGAARVAPQFWIPKAGLSAEASRRASLTRGGFCDITGQTNERSMMAAIIPPGVTCGNKVPTVLFPNDPSRERLDLWAAIVNSLPFDWLMRRVVTTTVNYFVLLGLRMPRIAPDDLPGRRLVDIARCLAALDASGAASRDLSWRIGELRAEADVLVAAAYGCTEADLLLMFEDFPLLDRGQPPLKGEATSTVTKDVVLSAWARRRRRIGSSWAVRAEAARIAGAVPYVPGEWGGEDKGDAADVV